MINRLAETNNDNDKNDNDNHNHNHNINNNDLQPEVESPKTYWQQMLRLSEGGMIRLETFIELIWLLIRTVRSYPLIEINKQLPVERFEATVS